MWGLGGGGAAGGWGGEGLGKAKRLWGHLLCS